MYELNFSGNTHYLKIDEYNTSFPKELTTEILEEWGVFEVNRTPKPTDYTKTITEGTPQLVDGSYIQIWDEVDATQSEIDTKLEDRWEVIRILRNELLLECDWTQLTDIPIETKELWQTYRQELRNITSQTNPFSIVWPVKP